MQQTAGERADAYLSATNVVKRYGRFTALDDVSFTVGQGEFVSVLGPSGCGKTTILRVVSGLDLQDAGAVRIDGRDVSALPVSLRNVGIVFQSYALFPNLTAAENVAYGLRGQEQPRTGLPRRVNELLALVGLTSMQSKYPAQLSGGQQQRVALARAMALSPRILLLDEPLSALDAKVRVHLRAEIKALQRRLGVTTIMVTHDQEEALTMADRILVMDHGTVVQQGAPRDVYDRPATPFVASFIGSMNFLGGAKKRGDGAFELAGHVLAAGREPIPLAAGQEAMLGIRPEDVVLSSRERPDGSLRAMVRAVEFRGPGTRVSLTFAASGREIPIEADIPAVRARELGLDPGMVLNLSLPAERVSAYQAA
jgi:iron(III) transport system ATP-binding protein